MMTWDQTERLLDEIEHSQKAILAIKCIRQRYVMLNIVEYQIPVPIKTVGKLKICNVFIPSSK